MMPFTVAPTQPHHLQLICPFAGHAMQIAALRSCSATGTI